MDSANMQGTSALTPKKEIIKINASKSETAKLRVAGYARVSSDSADQMNSFSTQVNYYQRTINGNPMWQMAEVYADEGISGVSVNKRDDFSRMIADCKRGKIDRIITKSTSRFARNTLDAIGVIRELKDIGVTVYFEKENLDTATLTSENLLTLYSLFAQEESMTISKNCKKGARMRMSKGTYVSSNAPYGYRLVNNELVIEETEAEIVRRIFSEYLGGKGYSAIAKDLMADEIPFKNNKMKWRSQTVGIILKNERYVGDMLLQKSYSEDALPYRKRINKGELPQYYVTNTHEPIVERIQFELAKILAQADYTEGDTFTGYTAKPTGEETILPDKAFVKGDIVSITVDTVHKKLGFKIGGSGVNQTLPPQIRSFAVTSGNAQNKLSWLLPVDTSTYEGLVIIKKVGSAPTKVSDGTKISLSKTATSYTDTGLTNDTKYYYRAFPYNSKKQYQTELTGAVAWGTPKAIDPIFGNNSWEVIDTVSKSGNIPSTWKVGDTKDIMLTTGETLSMQTYGFKHDDLANGGKAGITMGMRHLMGDTKRMFATYTNAGGFTSSEMYKWLQDDLFNKLPNDLKPYVKTVNKKTSAGSQSTTINTNAMKLFLFAEIEIWGGTSNSFNGEGSPYSIVSVGGKDNRIKRINNGNGTTMSWWLRSPYRSNSECFCDILDTGDTHATGSVTHMGVCFGFCI